VNFDFLIPTSKKDGSLYFHLVAKKRGGSTTESDYSRSAVLFFATIGQFIQFFR
jgi:hypothetical protein